MSETANPGLNLAPFGHWTALMRRRLTLRWASPEVPAQLEMLLIGVLAFALAGCCAFVPCHPATALVGTVVTADGAPLSSARLSLYGSSVRTDSKGCFKVRLPDAFPFTFVTVAEGYKPIEVKAKAGFYRAKVNLVPVQSAEASRIEWLPISTSDYETFSCP